MTSAENARMRFFAEIALFFRTVNKRIHVFTGMEWEGKRIEA